MRRPVLKDFPAAKESVAWSDDCHCLLDDNLQKRSKEKGPNVPVFTENRSPVQLPSRLLPPAKVAPCGAGITIDPRAAHISSHEPYIYI